MPNATRIFSLAFAALVVGLYTESHWPAPGLPKAGRPPQQNEDSESRHAQKVQHGIDSARPISPAQIEQLTAGEKARKNEQEATPDWWLIGLTGILAAATIGLWLATRDLVRGAETTAERQLRVYITVKKCRVLCERRPQGWVLAWHPTIVNTGQTPAYDLRWSATVAIKPVSFIPDIVSLEKLETSGEGSQYVLGPGQTLWKDSFLDSFVSDQELKELQRGRWSEKAFFLWGFVVYRDIFNKKRHTTFCAVTDWDRQEKPHSRVCSHHNDAD